MDELTLTAEQEEHAEQLFQQVQQTYLDEARRLCRVLAAKPDAELLGKTEFQLRDALRRLGATTLQTALSGRKKGGTRGPA